MGLGVQLSRACFIKLCNVNVLPDCYCRGFNSLVFSLNQPIVISFVINGGYSPTKCVWYLPYLVYRSSACQLLGCLHLMMHMHLSHISLPIFDT